MILKLRKLAIKTLATPKEKKQFKYEENVNSSLKVLEQTVDALDSLNIPYYLDFGTLLGAVRNEGFISWDDDIDLSLVNKNDAERARAVLKKTLEKKYLKITSLSFDQSISNRIRLSKLDPEVNVYVRHINFSDPHSLRIIKVRDFKLLFRNRLSGVIDCFGKAGKLIVQGKSCLDIFIKYPKDGRVYWMAQNKVHSLPIEFETKELIEIEFYHLKCKIPKYYDEYLTAIYGDWKKEKEDWQYYEKDTCIDKSSQTSSQ